MFQIEIKHPNNEGNFYAESIYVVFRCPECGHEGSFRFYAPEDCEKCSKKLPNVAALLTDVHDKILYYKHGYTVSPRTFDETISTIIDERT